MKNALKLLGCIFLALCLSNCKQSSKTKSSEITKEKWTWELPAWAKDANIYEVNIRQFSEEGSFDAFTTVIPRLQEMGVEILWLMPIFPISDTKKKGSLGSYYAVSDFRATNPEFGTMEDMEELISEAHRNDMKVILDWVPNHTGWDHIWLKEHPEFYTKDSLGNVTDPLNPETGESWGWSDVADLNYDNQELRDKMLTDMKYWVQEKNIDGFRMDVAHAVPLDFWDQVAKELKTIDQNLFLLAEAQEAELLVNDYFHMGYGWDFHHLLNDVAQGKANVDDLFAWLDSRENQYGDGILMHFTSNHDENSWAGTVFDRMGDAHQAMAVITYTFDGMPLVYSGMEEPMRKRLQFFEKDVIGFEKLTYVPFYTTLNKLKKENQALWNDDFGGPVERLSDSKKVLAFQREKNGNKVIVIVNTANENQNIKLDIDVSQMEEVFSGNSGSDYNMNNLTLSPYQFIIFTNK